MDDILRELEGLSEEESVSRINKFYDKLLKQLPYDFPELYGMTEEEVEKEERRINEERRNLLNEYNSRRKVVPLIRSKATNNTSQSNPVEISFNVAPAFKNKLRYLKEFKMKNPPNPHPGKVRPSGQSAHPGRAKRNKAYRKKAKLNQTKIKSVLADAAVVGLIFGAIEGVITELMEMRNTKKLKEKIRKMSKGFKDRLVLDIFKCKSDDKDNKDGKDDNELYEKDIKAEFEKCENIDNRIELFQDKYNKSINSYINDNDKVKQIINNYDLRISLKEAAIETGKATVLGAADSFARVGTSVGIGKGIQMIAKTSVKTLSGPLLFAGSATVDAGKSLFSLFKGKNKKEVAIEFGTNTAANVVGTAAMVGASLFTTGFAIPLMASVGVTCATTAGISGIQKFVDKKQQKEKYIEAKVETVAESFQKMRGVNNNVIGEDIKEFLEDIYICDSEEIIHLEDEVYYRWNDIENGIRNYEKRELENLSHFTDDLEEVIFVLCSLLDYNNLRLLLLDYDVTYPSELYGNLLCFKCARDIRKRIDYYNRYIDELEELPISQLKRINDDISCYDCGDELKEELQNLIN